jgi:hypothetical protein
MAVAHEAEEEAVTERVPGTAEQAVAAAGQAFCALESPLDDPRRVAEWARLGELHAAADLRRDAGLCWTRALWLAPDAAAIADAWARSEARHLGIERHQVLELLPRFDDPTHHQARTVAAELAAHHAAGTSGLPEGVDLAELQRWLRHHRRLLDLRSQWLAHTAIAACTGGDRLGLMQARDAILNDLRDGMPAVANVPAFVRCHDSLGDVHSAPRLGRELDGLVDNALTSPRQQSSMEAPLQLTGAYLHLLAAWGLATLGETDAARQHHQEARQLLGEAGSNDPVHAVCRHAYEARIDQALKGMPLSSPLPNEITRRRSELDRLERYKVDRLYQASHILEPVRQLDPFASFTRQDRDPAAAGLVASGDAQLLAAHIDYQIERLDQLEAAQLETLLELLSLLPTADTVERLQRLLGLAGRLSPGQRLLLLRESVLVADTSERDDLVTDCLSAFEQLAADTDSVRDLASTIARCGPALRRAGLTARVRVLLEQLHRLPAGDTAVDQVQARLALVTAGAAIGDTGGVTGSLTSAFSVLPGLALEPRLELIRAIGMALARTTADQAIAGVQRLLGQLPQITDSYNTNSHFCLSMLHFFESMVLTLASDDLSMSTWARAWVEQDTHLLVRRIASDLRREQGDQR